MAEEKPVEWDFDRVFYPTIDLYLHSGTQAITDFRDRARSDDAEERKRHAVLITHADIEQLKRQSHDYAFAKETLSFILKRISDVPGGREIPVDLDDNLFLIVSGATRLEDVREKHRELFSGDRPKFEVICMNEGEAILYHEKGFKAGISQFDKVNPAIRREGIKSIVNSQLYADMIQEIEANKKQHSKDTMTKFPVDMFADHEIRIFPNQYLLVRPEGGGKPIVGYIVGDIEWNKDRSRMVMDENLEFRTLSNHELYEAQELGIKPRDIHQALYMHALRQPHISRIFATGGPSSGKTVVGYASVLAQTLKRYRGSGTPTSHELEDERGANLDSRFRKIFITKPIDLMGGASREMGFLPGSEEQKIWNYIQSYVDAHDELDLQVSIQELTHGIENSGTPHAWKDVHHGLYMPVHGGLIEIQDYNKWLGRTIGGSVIFADEAQNLDPYEFQGINTRTGLGSLVIISGDYEQQIYNRSLSTLENGLFQGLLHYMGKPYVSIIHLEGSYRDQGAEDAAAMHVQRRPGKR